VLDAATPTCVAEGNLAQRTPRRRIWPARRRVVTLPGDAGIVDARTHWIAFVDAPATACVLEAILVGGAVEDHAAAFVGIVISVVDARTRGIGAKITGVAGFVDNSSIATGRGHVPFAAACRRKKNPPYDRASHVTTSSSTAPRRHLTSSTAPPQLNGYR